MNVVLTIVLAVQMLSALGIIHEPLVILNTNTAVYIGMVYSYLPFMVLRNFQAFVDTLDSAIAQQRTALVMADQRIEAAKPDWRLKKQKLGSYEVLAARGEAMLAKKAARVEQRESDEHAAKILRMRAERA